jgi:hypothetical protein
MKEHFSHKKKIMKPHEGAERSCSRFVLFLAVVVITKKEVAGSHFTL